MRKLYLTLLTTSLFSQLSFGQWAQQSALPTGRAIKSSWFLTPTHGFAVGVNHQILETTNGGDTWSYIMDDDIVNTDPFYQVAFGDALHGFITGNTPTLQDILKTSDGGQTWTRVNNFTYPGSWYHIDFVSPQKTFFGTNGACVFTPDGGNSFVLKSDTSCPNMYGMDFRDEQVGLVAGEHLNSSGVFKTYDGGATWKQVATCSANDVLWLSNTYCVATALTEIYISSDEGENWNQITGAVFTGLMELEKIDSMTIAGVSAKGDIWRSADRGLSWSLVLDGLGDLPEQWSIRFIDNTNGWMVGQYGLMYRSVDGGMTWKQISNGAGPQIRDMKFLNDNFGMAVGENGYIFRTTNGGNFWEMQKLEATGQIFGRTESLHGICIVDSTFAAAAGPGGTVFKTTDGGVSWQSIGYPNLPDLFWIEDVEFINHNIGWVVGLDQDLGHKNTVYQTTDGGATWNLAINQGGFLWDVDFTDSLHGWIVAVGGLYFKTIDGGVSWNSSFLAPYFITPTISDIGFANANVGWAVGWDGYVAHTTNGGATWTLQDIGTTTDHLFSLQVISATEAWATGRHADSPMDGVVYHTTDGGLTWNKEITSPEFYWGYAIAGTKDNVWIGGYEGRIYHKSLATEVPEEKYASSMTIQSFPNPFHFITNLRYQVVNSGLVSLKVFDIIGKQVATLVDKPQQAGIYEVLWNAAGLSPGIYTYRYEHNDSVVTGKIILQ